MKNRFAIATAAVLLGSLAVFGFTGQQHTQGHDQHQQTTTTDQKSMMCPMMAQMGPEHMKKMMETTAKLDELVTTMKSSKGDQHDQAVNQIVETLVNERKAMHKMMMGGMDHGGGSEANMANCPMHGGK